MLPKGKSKNEVFSDSGLEKEVRSAVKSAAVRLLSKDTVVIVDGSNYIKGFRYEVWCASKATKTTQCTVQCDVSPEDARKWNEKRCLGASGMVAEAFISPNFLPRGCPTPLDNHCKGH